jgi:hypothetical protein
MTGTLTTAFIDILLQRVVIAAWSASPVTPAKGWTSHPTQLPPQCSSPSATKWIRSLKRRGYAVKSALKWLLAIVLCLGLVNPVAAKDYYSKKWFSYPDPLSRVRDVHIGKRCVRWVIVDLLVGKSKSCPLYKPVLRVEYLQRDVTVQVTGPKLKPAIERAVLRAVTACAVKAYHDATGAAGATPSPEPAARIAAATGTLATTFVACIKLISIADVGLSVLNKFKIKIVTKGRWSRKRLL